MALGNAYVESAVRHLCLQDIHAAAGWHSRGDTHYSLVFFGQLQQRFSKDMLPQLGVRLLQTNTCIGVELAGCVPHNLVRLGRRVTVALAGDQMQHFGTGVVFYFAQNLDDSYHIVPVRRPEIP